MRIFLLLLLTLNLFGSNLVIDTIDREFDNFEVGIYEDKTNSLTLKDIQKIKNFKSINSNISLGYSNSTFWYYFSLSNKTDREIKRVLYLTQPNFDNLDIFVVEDNHSIKKLSKGITRLNSEGKVDRSYPKISLDLLPNKTKKIYIKISTSFPHIFSIKLFSTQSFIDYKVLINSFLYAYFGALASLILYNFFIYKYLNDITYLLYVLFVFFYGLSQYHMFALYPFNTSSSIKISQSWGSVHIFWFAFHTFFSRKLLNITNYYPKIDKFIKYIGYFLLLVGFIGVFELAFAVKIMNILMLLIPPFIFTIAILLYFKKNQLALFYIIAQSVFISSSVIFGLLYAGVIEYNNFTIYINLVGSLTEAVLFSLALAYYTHILKEENSKQKELVDEYSKLSFLGQTFINIYHQWKSPINNIFNLINHIETAREFKDKNLDKIIDRNINKIKYNTHYLKDTALNYLDFYNNSNLKNSKFNLCEEINSIIKLIKSEVDKSHIQIKISCDEQLYFNGVKNCFDNLLMVLFENSINISKKRKIKNLKINIEILSIDNSIKILFKDNAGGVEYKPINAIFEKNISSHSSGIGLYMAKYFLIKNLNGTINVKNSDNGAIFEIFFKKIN